MAFVWIIDLHLESILEASVFTILRLLTVTLLTVEGLEEFVILF